mgnify:CR=1 FL=1
MKRFVLFSFIAVVTLLFASCTRKADVGEQLLQQLNEQKVSLVVYNNDSVSTYSQRGIRDLINLYLNEPERLHNAVIADKMVGKAAATMMVLGKVKEVNTNYLTIPAKQLLEEAGINYRTKSEGDMIYQADGVSQCPMDKLASEFDSPDDRLKAFIEFYHL